MRDTLIHRQDPSQPEFPMRVSRSSAALMKRHDRSNLQPPPPRECDNLQIALPIVNPRPIPLHQAPPYLHDHALNSGRRQRAERLRHGLGPPHLASGAHGVDRERDEHRRSPPPALRGESVKQLVLEIAAIIRRHGAAGAGRRRRVEPRREGESRTAMLVVVRSVPLGVRRSNGGEASEAGGQ